MFADSVQCVFLYFYVVNYFLISFYFFFVCPISESVCVSANSVSSRKCVIVVKQSLGCEQKSGPALLLPSCGARDHLVTCPSCKDWRSSVQNRQTHINEEKEEIVKKNIQRFGLFGFLALS